MANELKSNDVQVTPAQIAVAESHPIGTEDSPGWQYNGVSPSTGKDYWIQIEDFGIMDHFNAASYAKEHDVRLMSDAEGKQTCGHRLKLKGAFDPSKSYWLAEHPITKNPKVQRFNDGGAQYSFFRNSSCSVRFVRDNDPRLER
jgi:hypothetical protein